MNRICYVGRPDPTNQQLMMYLTVNGASPAGAFAGEDAIPFNLAKVTAEQSGGSWIVTDTASIMLNFGISEANARRAVWIIKKYGFTPREFLLANLAVTNAAIASEAKNNPQMAAYVDQSKVNQKNVAFYESHKSQINALMNEDQGAQ